MRSKIISFLESRLISIVCIISLLIATFYKVNISDIISYETLLTNIITVTSIFIGILMSMLGFLLTVSGKAVVKNIKKFGVHRKIINYFIMPTFSGVIIVILSICISLFDAGKINRNIAIVTSILWIMLIIYFILSFLRIIILMYFILINVFEEEDHENRILKGNYEEDKSSLENKNINHSSFDNPDDFY